jgi:CubicO group peptidase (beta-lactamase class C family)
MGSGRSIQGGASDVGISGYTAPGYEAVRAEFAAVAAEQHAALGDYEAQLAAYADGERVVDLWTGADFDGDALTGVFSAAKGATALVVALLVQDGVLELDQRVAHYWPEFAAAGKGRITMRELLSHRAGLVGVEGGLRAEELADDRLIAERLAAQAPFWQPGAAFGYHALVFGALANEVVLRATGQSVQHLHEQRVRAPHGLDFYLGLPAELEPRFRTTLPMLPTPEQRAALAAAGNGPAGIPAIALNRGNPEAPELGELPNIEAFRRSGPASIGGTASARGLAGLYAAAISGLDGAAPLLKPDTAAEFGRIHSVGLDLVFRVHGAFAIGFSSSADRYPVLGQGAFGHSGAAGQESFADPRSGLAYGYNRRRMAFPGGAAPENDRLIRAVHAAVVGRRG